MPQLDRFVSQPYSTEERIGDALLRELEDATKVSATIAFANASGVRHLAPRLSELKKTGRSVRVTAGVDGEVTSAPGVRALHRLVAELFLFRHPGRPLFHPKTWLIEQAGRKRAVALVGSANLTESALWVNYEQMAVITFKLDSHSDRTAFESLWQDHNTIATSPNAVRATDKLISHLVDSGLLKSEVYNRKQKHARRTGVDATLLSPDSGDPIFPPTAPATPPFAQKLDEEITDQNSLPQESDFPPHQDSDEPPKVPSSSDDPAISSRQAFILRLGHRDTQQEPKSPSDVFVPLAAWRDNRAFWGDISETAGSERRVLVEFRRQDGSTETDDRRIYFWEPRKEMRINAPQLHEDAVEGDLMLLELAPHGVESEYIASVVRPKDPLFNRYLEIAENPVRNSNKRWGYC